MVIAGWVLFGLVVGAYLALAFGAHVHAQHLAVLEADFDRLHAGLDALEGEVTALEQTLTV